MKGQGWAESKEGLGNEGGGMLDVVRADSPFMLILSPR